MPQFRFKNTPWISRRSATPTPGRRATDRGAFSRVALAACTAASLIVSSGCGHLVQLKRDVRRLESDSRLVGQISAETNTEQPGHTVVAVITRKAEGPPSILDAVALATTETVFAFSVPPSDFVQLAAFQDENDDGVFQEDEPAWLGKELSAQDRNADRRLPNQTVVLQRGTRVPEKLLSSLREARGGRSLAELPGEHLLRMSLGLIEDFNSARFSRDAANLGFWEPLEFLNRHGAGIYFLEPYDPNRIPVLLVHGAAGSPGDWQPLVPLLDQSRHQIWLFGYPSGLRLADSAKILQAVVTRLHERYGFQRLDVIAHSMGGLVARDFLLKQPVNSTGLPGAFITLSTPWIGHASAGFGVKYTPVAIPSWLDLQPNSEFQTKLFAQPLAANRPYYLAFSYRGSASVILPESNDGVVSIESELSIHAQREARSLRGFNESHTSILSSKETAAWINEILSSSADKR